MGWVADDRRWELWKQPWFHLCLLGVGDGVGGSAWLLLPG